MTPSTYLQNLQLSTNWRAQYNPLRGLTLPQVVALLEAAERGNYARLQWLYRFIEKRNPTLRAVLQRRQAALTRLDWDIRLTADAATPPHPRALAARQAAALREAYDRIENLREAITFLALAEFRGYAQLERNFDAQGRTIRLQPVPQWFWARLGPDAPWQYNAQARPGLPLPGDPVLDPARFLVRECDAPIDEIAVIAHVRQSLSQKDWDGFIETYGLPPLFLELPPDIPAEREAEFQAQAEAIIGDARGTVPHGTRIQTVDAGARGQNPFAEHLRYQDELIVLAATGGKLTVLTSPGSGTLAGNAHQQAFDDLTQSEAALISEIFRAQFDVPLLAQLFPGQPQLAYFELSATRALDPAQTINDALQLARAGYAVDPAELSEKNRLPPHRAPTRARSHRRPTLHPCLNRPMISAPPTPAPTTHAFTLPPDAWFHIAPLGSFAHPSGTQQVIDPAACDAIVGTFREEAAQPNFPGLLVDFDHFSHDPAQASAAAGWITALERRDNGLHAQVRWSDLGHQALTGGRYRLASPVWNRADCDQWTAPIADRDTLHLRPRRLDRLALTNDPNLPGLVPLTNRSTPPPLSTQPVAAAVELTLASAPLPNLPPPLPSHPHSQTKTTSHPHPMSLRPQLLQTLELPGTASDDDLLAALRNRAQELATLRRDYQHLREAQTESDLARFADVITHRDTVRAQLLANRESTLALLNSLHRPEPPAPLHRPGRHRPALHLLSPLAASHEATGASARRVANRARQLQSELKISHHSAFRLAEGEAIENEAA